MSTHEMRIGLEIEALLGQRDTNAKELSLEDFAKIAARSYNAKIDRRKYLTMHPDIDGTWDGDEYKDWSLTDDATIVGATKTKCTSDNSHFALFYCIDTYATHQTLLSSSPRSCITTLPECGVLTFRICSKPCANYTFSSRTGAVASTFIFHRRRANGLFRN